MRAALVLALGSLTVALASCRDNESVDPPLVCLDAGAVGPCEPGYEPTYDNVYANTFQPRCAKSGFSCHSPEGHQGGLDFFDKEAVYGQLLQRSVRAGSPECSNLVARVKSLDGFQRMPPGRSLSDGDQCAIVEWIRAGAKR